MAMHADRYPARITHPGAEIANQNAVLLRNGVARRVRNIKHRGAGVNHRFEHLKEIIPVGPACILGIKLDVIGVAPGELHCFHSHFQDGDFLLGERPPVFVIAELAQDVNIGRPDSGMDPRALGLSQRLAAGMNVVGHGAGERADRNVLDLARDVLHRREVLRRRVGVACLYNIHPQLRKLSGDAQLLAPSEARSRSLFAIAQSRIEYIHLLRLH